MNQEVVLEATIEEPKKMLIINYVGYSPSNMRELATMVYEHTEQRPKLYLIGITEVLSLKDIHGDSNIFLVKYEDGDEILFDAFTNDVAEVSSYSMDTALTALVVDSCGEPHDILLSKDYQTIGSNHVFELEGKYLVFPQEYEFRSLKSSVSDFIEFDELDEEDVDLTNIQATSYDVLIYSTKQISKE